MYTKPILYALLGNNAASVEAERAEIAHGDASRWAQLTSVVLQLADSVQSLAGKQPSDDTAMSESTDGMLNLVQAANYLGYRPAGLRKACKRGDVRYSQVGQGPYRFRKEWLDEFVNGPAPVEPSRRKASKPTASSHGLDPALLKI
jgi:hypothetical protein